MKKITLLSLFTFLAISLFAADEWKIKEDGVSISIVDKKFKGSFNNLTGTILFAVDDLSNSSFDVAINTPEIEVDGSGMQEKHVKSDKWLDVEHYNTISFTSSSIIETDKGYEAKGSMTMHGVTQEVSIPFTFTETEDGGVFQGTFVVNRKSYEIGPNGGTVETVEVTIKVGVTK